MRKGFFARLAVVNIRKNKQIYVPYILACLFNVAMLYMMLFINHNAGMKTIRHSGDVLMITTMGQHHKLKKKMERNLFAGSFHCVKI